MKNINGIVFRIINEEHNSIHLLPIEDGKLFEHTIPLSDGQFEDLPDDRIVFVHWDSKVKEDTDLVKLRKALNNNDYNTTMECCEYLIKEIKRFEIRDNDENKTTILDVMKSGDLQKRVDYLIKEEM